MPVGTADTEMEYTDYAPQKCSCRPPQHLVDFLPSDPHPLHQFANEYQQLEEVQKSKHHCTEQSEPQRLPTPLPPSLFESEPNAELTIYHVADAPTFVHETAAKDSVSPLAGFGPTAQELVDQPPGYYTKLLLSLSECNNFPIMSWYYSSKNLSLGALDHLVYNVILAPDFQCEDLEGFSAVQENRHLDDEASDHLPETSESLPWLSSDVWRKSSVFLPLPFTHKSYKSEKHAPTIQIHFYH
ncbi:hypothetical protein H2248_000255 [Termitomyces sp. 'cryptogamus']|nr:hypothetical protein H2248_000255 [Termitomyces sp. 'cryptogamus']